MLFVSSSEDNNLNTTTQGVTQLDVLNVRVLHCLLQQLAAITRQMFSVFPALANWVHNSPTYSRKFPLETNGGKY